MMNKESLTSLLEVPGTCEASSNSQLNDNESEVLQGIPKNASVTVTSDDQHALVIPRKYKRSNYEPYVSQLACYATTMYPNEFGQRDFFDELLYRSIYDPVEEVEAFIIKTYDVYAFFFMENAEMINFIEQLRTNIKYQVTAESSSGAVDTFCNTPTCA